MKTLNLNIQDSLDIISYDAILVLATQLYQSNKFSLGQASDVAGLTKKVFVELLVKNEVSIFNFQASDLINAVANA